MGGASDKNFSLEEMLKKVLTPERMTSMELRNLESSSGTHSFRLQGTGNREGSSDIKIRQENGEIIVEDSVELPQNNRGYAEDIVLLKKIMYVDAGAISSGDVTNLSYRKSENGYTLSFKSKADKAHLALHHFLDIASDIMGGYFREYGQIDLAFSMARSRDGR